MRSRDFQALHASLLRCGIQPRIADRVAVELREHYEDLYEEYRASGIGTAEAQERASAALGTHEYLVAAMDARRELKTWAFRYPHAGIVFYTLACLVALPARPVLAGVDHAPSLARWSASLLVAGAVTTAMLLLLQLSILFG